MGNKGIWLPETEKTLSQLVDDLYKGKGFVEVVDGLAARIVISTVDDTIFDKLPDEIKSKLNEATEHILAESYEQAKDILANVLNDVINIPKIDEDQELLLFQGILSIIQAAVLNKTTQ